MASKSNIFCMVDNGAGQTLTIEDNGIGYLKIIVQDSKGSAAIDLGPQDAATVRSVMVYSDALRRQIPTS